MPNILIAVRSDLAQLQVWAVLRAPGRPSTLWIRGLKGAYAEREPLRVATAELGGARSLLNVPMLDA